MPHSPIEVKADIDERLNGYFADRSRAARELDTSYSELWATMQTLALAGGKRLRPYMTVLSYECYGGDDYQSILEIALAEELLHLSLLIHDDIVDNDYVRHGVLNVAGQYRGIYSNLTKDNGTIDHYANAAALMGGDLLLSAAHTQVFASDFTAADKAAVLELFGQLTFEVAGGQHLDMEAVLHSITDSKPLQIARHKTASYSFVGPLVCGAMLAHAPAEDIEQLRQLGYALGTAFQLADDILGVFGDERTTGKSNNNDLREGKRTLLAQTAYRRVNDCQRERFDELFGREDLTDTQITELRDIFVDCGAKAVVETHIDAYCHEVLAIIGTLHISEQAQLQLQQLVSRATSRKS